MNKADIYIIESSGLLIRVLYQFDIVDDILTCRVLKDINLFSSLYHRNPFIPYWIIAWSNNSYIHIAVRLLTAKIAASFPASCAYLLSC